MGDPSNKNQSHLLQGRSTSRVLAPPGGHSSFSIGGYGGAPDYSTSSRGNTRNEPQRAASQRAPAPSEDQYQRRDLPKSYSLRDSIGSGSGGGGGGGRGGIPGLESHYDSGARGGSNKYEDNGGRQSYEEDDQSYHASSAAPKGMLRSNGGSLSGGDYAAQLKAQINMKKNMDNEYEGSDPYSSNRRQNSQGPSQGQSGGRQDSMGGGGGQGASHGSRSTRTLADSRHDSAMNAYSNRQESDRERDYRRMQNMEDKGNNPNDRGRNNDRGGRDDNRGGREDSYKNSSASQSGSAPVHTSTRVHAPPGGHSTFQLG
mmetsp:Transcript_12738/g.12395  ORF Transcript_12738/g.12395 Transcript_12738/m.12395 type:complete len:315 (+) Transcript_12738:223-1167(+)